MDEDEDEVEIEEEVEVELLEALRACFLSYPQWPNTEIEPRWILATDCIGGVLSPASGINIKIVISKCSRAHIFPNICVFKFMLYYGCLLSLSRW
jgi:hypothetical protein